MPVLHRSDLAKHTCKSNLTTHLGVVEKFHTSGTSGQDQLVITRGKKEKEFLDGLYSNLATRLTTNISDLRPRWISTCDSLAHGGTIIIESYAFKHVFDDPDKSDVELSKIILSLIAQPTPLEGVDPAVSVLATTSKFLAILTSVAKSVGWEPPDSMKYIFHGSSYLPLRSKEIIEKYWKADLLDVYSMAEIIGRGVGSRTTKCLNFQPSMIVEVVNPINHSPIRNGLGRGVITCLYPFVELHPRIRYLTSDLFEIKKGDCIRYVGRLENSGADMAKRVAYPIVKPVDFYDAVDQIPEVTRSLDGVCLAQEGDELGVPEVRVKRNANNIIIKARVSFNAEDSPDHVLEIADKIQNCFYRSMVNEALFHRSGIKLSVSIIGESENAEVTISPDKI